MEKATVPAVTSPNLGIVVIPRLQRRGVECLAKNYETSESMI
jgi:hypothetical protein